MGVAGGELGFSHGGGEGPEFAGPSFLAAHIVAYLYKDIITIGKDGYLIWFFRKIKQICKRWPSVAAKFYDFGFLRRPIFTNLAVANGHLGGKGVGVSQ